MRPSNPRQRNPSLPPVEVSPAGIINDPDGRVMELDVWIGPVVYRAAMLAILGGEQPEFLVRSPALRDRLRDGALVDVLADRLRAVAA